MAKHLEEFETVGLPINRLQSHICECHDEIRNLKSEIYNLRADYDELRGHHNQYCTCDDIY